MVGATQTLSVGWIEGCSTVPTLDNMVGEHAMTRSRLLAPLPLDDRLTSIPSTIENCGPPLAMLRSEEFRVSGFRRRFDRARIDSAQPDPHHFDLRHFWNHHHCGEAAWSATFASPGIARRFPPPAEGCSTRQRTGEVADDSS